MKAAAAVTETDPPCHGDEDPRAPFEKANFRYPIFITATASLVQLNGSALNFLLSRTQLETVEYFLLFFVNPP